MKARLMELKQESKGAALGQKSGQKEVDTLRKDLDKARKKIQDLETKLKTAVQVMFS